MPTKNKPIGKKALEENEISISINAPIHKVFEFTTNPVNTPKWIENIVHEEVNGLPVRVGSIYKNVNRKGEWAEYEVVRFDKERMFELQQRDSPYHVLYVYTPLPDDGTRLTYFEWVDKGNLEEPFTLSVLEKLKSLLEKR